MAPTTMGLLEMFTRVEAEKDSEHFDGKTTE
jgi:hypothetical protein